MISLLEKRGIEKLVRRTLSSISNERRPRITGKDKDTPMREKHTEEDESKGILYNELEEFARQEIRQHL